MFLAFLLCDVRYQGVSHQFQKIKKKLCPTMTKTMTNTCIYDIETKPSLQALQVKDALNYSDSSITYSQCLY
jgi:hypothetical protein